MKKPDWSQLGLHVIAKPTGPVCNIRCEYCFYLEKEKLYPEGEKWKMSDQTLEAYVRQYIEAQPPEVEEIDFAFQGGEPTLLGIDFFRRAIELQKQYAPDGKKIHNSLQTNGIKLDDRWCEFLKENGFLVGLSLDGPADLHNRYRVDRQGRGTHDRVLRAMACLKKHAVEFNALVCVNRTNADHPRPVYRFFQQAGVEFLQFIPIVEPLPGVRSGEVKPELGAEPESLVGPRSVRPEQFGRFLIGVFDQWIENDVGRIFVRDFDQTLAAWVGVGASLCVYAKECGRATAIEHNGDLYSCDHYVEPGHKLGNVRETPIKEMVNSSFQERFGRDKWNTLPECCRKCRYLSACHGACPKDRILVAPNGQPGLNYLCAGFKQYFAHVDPYMKFMADEVRAGRPAATVMQKLRAERHRAREEAGGSGQPVRRNTPCPCGSGRKYKNCCMRR